MAFGLNIGDLLLTILADGSMLKKDIERQGLAAADAAGKTIGKSLGRSIADSLGRTGKSMAVIGKSMTQNLTLPILAAGTAITMVGLKFDTTLRRIVALTDVTADEIGGVREEILKLAPAIGKSPQELAEAFYFLASGGFNAKESMEILTQTAKAAATGLGETQDVAKVIGASINAFGKDTLSAEDAVDQLIRAIKDGTAEAPDFAGALGDVVGSAGLVGATFADTAGAIAAMTLQGISADEAATSLNQVFRALFKTTPAAAKGFAAVGLTVEGLRKQLKDEGLLPTLQTLEKAFAGNEVAAGRAFGEVRALRGVLALVGGDNLESTSRILNDVAAGMTTLGSAFADTEGPGREVDQAFAKMEVTLIELSEDVLPIAVELLSEFADIVKGAADVFKSLPEPVRSLTVKALALTAALGPLIWVTGKATLGFSKLLTALDILAGSRISKKIVATLFTPIIDAAAGLAGKITKPIVSAVETAYLKAMGNPALSGASNKLGTFMGSALGKALSLAFAAVAWMEVIATYDRIQKELAAQNDQISSDLSNVIREGTTADLEAAKNGLEQGLKEINGVWDAGLFTTETRRRMEADLAATQAELERRASGFGPAIANGMAQGEGALIKATDSLVDKVGNAVAAPKLSAAARAAGKSIPQSIAKGITDEQNAPAEAMASLLKLMKIAMYPAQRIARDIGILTSKALAKALKDKRPVVRQEAQRVRALTEKDLAQLILDGGRVGKAAGEKLKEGLRSKNPAVRAAAKRVRAIVNSELDKTVAPAGAAGERAGKAFSYRLTLAMKTALKNAAATIQAALDRAFSGSGPFIPPEERAIGGPVRAGVPYRVNENTPRSEVMVPSVGGHVLTHADAMAAVASSAGQGGGDTYYNVPVLGALPVRTARDIVTELRRAGELGILPAPTLPPTYPRREATPR